MTSDFTKNDATYDVIFDAVGKIAYSRVKKSLKKTGIYLNVLTSYNNLKLKTVDLVFLKDSIHVIAFFVAGIAASLLLDYEKQLATGILSTIMKPMNSPWMAIGPTLEIF